jgi:hypothetical protein
MKCDCGSRTDVVQTMQVKDTVKRRRKCVDCKKLLYTLEVRAEVLDVALEPPEPRPPGLIKPMAAAAKTIHQKRVEARRSNEDRRNRVPSYYIEDDEY